MSQPRPPLPTKRQRTEDVIATRSDVWHKDGSVVLQAENTQFRVHWSILAINSPFFHDMQDLPQPPDSATVDGYPVVELQDASIDVGHLLRVLYNPYAKSADAQHFSSKQSIPMPVVIALVRLGRKYEFTALLRSAVERLNFDHPTTLKELSLRLPIPGRILRYPGIVIDVITLARENNILSVLPEAYYRALRHTQADIFDGVPRGDTTVASLASIDQRRCVVGREALLVKQFQRSYTLGWLANWDYPAAECLNPARCSTQRASLLSLYLNNPKIRIFAAMPRKSTLAGREKAWNELPNIFGLSPSWDELKNEI
ncbi:hypothetical protein B0H16DRAFT_1493980 [Mycena metata]|uniref:BTB domain-containing protein n=1 Tax=Mycena metata TaxID=1033252 RepID=A0AAD7KDU0_9AGAR|nr:hypothetical protein B0H16DRAFT_1493980 [Mycena metata]